MSNKHKRLQKLEAEAAIAKAREAGNKCVVNYINDNPMTAEQIAEHEAAGVMVISLEFI